VASTDRRTDLARPLWPLIRRIWATLGSIAFIGFVLWCLVAYRASAEAKAGLNSDALVTVARGDGWWTFSPARPLEPPLTLLFLAGALVDPEAYAPLMHQVAAHGHPAHLIALPWRGAFGRADGEDFLDALRSFMDTIPGRWVVAGHSRGAKIAALLARQPTPRMAGLILLGTTHPRDFSLADTRLTVTKIYGTRDGVAPADKVLANASLLPPATTWVPIEGGNHHQFGYYGFQPGDRWASVSRMEQQAQTLAAMLSALGRVREEAR
jgi:pimeloyl-ACP methyl ester carboxylesterase